MPSTPATNAIGVQKQAAGENLNTWGDTKLNDALQVLANLSVGWKPWTINGDYTVSETNYSTTNDTENAFVKLTAGTVAAAFNVTLPGRSKCFVMWNATSYAATIKLSATSGFSLSPGRIALVATDGVTDVYNGAPTQGGVTIPAYGADIPNYTALQTYVAAQIAAATLGTGAGFFQRYIYTATGGETSKSGADDNGLTLAYTVGSERVFLNGVMLVRSTDYVAATGTSITGLTALSASDILEVINFASFSVANTYTQAQTNALLALKTTNSAAAITGGTISGVALTLDSIENTPIGVATPAAGNFTTIGATTRGTIAATTGNFSGQATFSTVTVTSFTATQISSFTAQTTFVTVQVSSFTATQLAAFTSGTFSTTLGVTGVATLTGGFNATANSTIGGTPPATGKLGIVGASGGISLSLSDNVNNSLYVKHSSGAVALGTDGSGAIAICANGFTPVITCSVASSKANVTWNTPPTSSAGLASGTLYSNAGIATFA